jgi:hypothetical protein
MDRATFFRDGRQVPADAGMTRNPTNTESGAATTENEIRFPFPGRAAQVPLPNSASSFLRKQETVIPAKAGNKNLFYLCRKPKYQVRVSIRKKEK